MVMVNVIMAFNARLARIFHSIFRKISGIRTLNSFVSINPNRGGSRELLGKAAPLLLIVPPFELTALR